MAKTRGRRPAPAAAASAASMRRRSAAVTSSGAFDGPRRLAHGHDRIEDAAHRRGFEGEYRSLVVPIAGKQPHRTLHVAVGDGADIAQLLRQHQTGVDAFQQRLVERVDAAAGVDRLADVAVNLGAGAFRVVDQRARHRRNGRGLRRKVALMRHPRQAIAESKGKDDLRTTWQ